MKSYAMMGNNLRKVAVCGIGSALPKQKSSIMQETKLEGVSQIFACTILKQLLLQSSKQRNFPIP